MIHSVWSCPLREIRFCIAAGVLAAAVLTAGAGVRPVSLVARAEPAVVHMTDREKARKELRKAIHRAQRQAAAKARAAKVRAAKARQQRQLARQRAIDARNARVKVPLGAVFNAPTGSSYQQQAVAGRLAWLIRGVPLGGSIHVALYRLSDWSLAKELVAAGKRTQGAVQIIVDSDSIRANPRIYNYLRKNLGPGQTRRTWIVACPWRRGCLAPYYKGWGKNHNKFFLFSRSYGASNVVFQTSANGTPYAATKQWNDGLTVSDSRLYRYYREYFADLARRRSQPGYHRTRAAGRYKVEFFPTSGHDPIVAALNRLSCAGGTKVFVSQGVINRVEIARRLWDLHDAGCDVRAVVGVFGSAALWQLRRPGGRNGGPRVRYFHTVFPEADSVHSKYLLVEERGRKTLFTGSHSFDGAGLLANDEAWLEVSDERLWNQYAWNFDRVFWAAPEELRPYDAPGQIPPTIIVQGGALALAAGSKPVKWTGGSSRRARSGRAAGPDEQRDAGE